jgi:hypothetical protein
MWYTSIPGSAVVVNESMHAYLGGASHNGLSGPMKTIRYYLDRAKARQGIASERALARALNTQVHVFNEWGTPRRTPTEEQWEAVLRMCELSPDEAMEATVLFLTMRVHTEPLKSRINDLWRSFRNTGAGTGLLAAALAGGPSSAHATVIDDQPLSRVVACAQTGNSAPPDRTIVYIMRLLARAARWFPATRPATRLGNRGRLSIVYRLVARRLGWSRLREPQAPSCRLADLELAA